MGNKLTLGQIAQKNSINPLDVVVQNKMDKYLKHINQELFKRDNPVVHSIKEELDGGGNATKHILIHITNNKRDDHENARMDTIRIYDNINSYVIYDDLTIGDIIDYHNRLHSPLHSMDEGFYMPVCDVIPSDRIRLSWSYRICKRNHCLDGSELRLSYYYYAGISGILVSLVL